MKIVNIQGGLGNQMFQYALYLSLKKRYPNEVVRVDASHMASYKVHNGLELERVFGIKLDQASKNELLKVTLPIKNYKLRSIIRRILPSRKTEVSDKGTNLDEIFRDGNLYLDGYWQNFRIFHPQVEKEIREAFIFKLPLGMQNEQLLKDIQLDDKSVSIHVRRGDYLNNKWYVGLCGLDYYQLAIKYIQNNIDNPRFFIFSDDLNWINEKIIPLLGSHKHQVVNWNRGLNSALDVMMMSKCRTNIIANSSFSWWAAYLNINPNKIVCAPKIWINNPGSTYRQMPEWILF